MSLNNIVSFSRLDRLMTNDLKSHQKIILITLACMAVFFVLFQTLPSYFLVLYVGGFILTSHAFKAVHSRHRVLQSLLLPCSNVERFLAPWLLCAVLYPLALLLAYDFFSWLQVLLSLWLAHQSIYPLNLLAPALWLGVAKYIVLQSMVLLGAIAFKKYPLMKTALVMGCLLLFVLMVAAVFKALFFPELVFGLMLLKWIFWLALAPVCWVVTYLKLTEYELS